MSTTPNPVPQPTPAPPVPNYRPYRPRSIFGPLVLIVLGLLFLAHNVGWLPGHTIAWWFSRWWPAVLILWGIVKVFEYTWSRYRGEPAPRGIGAGGIIFLVFFILFGLTATGLSRLDWGNWNNNWNTNWNFDNDSDWPFFSNRYVFTENLSQSVAEAVQMKVLSGLGDINVTSSADAEAHLYVHKTMHDDSQEAANRLNDSTHPKFVQQGKVWILDLTGGNFERGRFNLDLQLPTNLALSVTARRGDISVDQRTGDVELSTGRGELTAKDVKGNVALHIHHGDVTVDDITGNVQIEGSGSDTTINNVTGTLTVSGEYGGDSHYSKVGGQVRFKSSRTDLQLAKLDGELTLDSDDLHADAVSGPFKLDTRSKSVHLENVTGDIHIDDTNAGVEIETKSPLGAIDINNTRGGIDLSLPSNASFQVDAASKDGEITSEFGINIDNQNRNATARGSLGKGGPVVHLRSERGTIQIKKRD